MEDHEATNLENKKRSIFLLGRYEREEVTLRSHHHSPNKNKALWLLEIGSLCLFFWASVLAVVVIVEF